MKKFIAVLLVTFTFATSSFATTSDDIYVRKDVFEVHMLNINQNLERISNRLDNLEASMNELTKAVSSLTEKVSALSERVDGNFAVLSARIDRLDSRIDGTNTRIDDLRNGLYLWLVVIGTFIAWPKAKNFLQQHSAQKQSFTLDDVERLIDAKLKAKSQ